MKKSVLLLVALTACQPWGMSHVPTLVEPAKDKVKFQSDLDFCRKDMLRRSQVATERHKGNISEPLFGAVGIAVSAAADNTGDDYYKSQGTIIDECMTAKGYKLAN